MQYSYLAALLVSLAGLSVLDWRYQLAFYKNASRTAKTLAVGVVIFSVWDLLGIQFGIFFSGHSRYATSWFIVKDFPIEELFFLTLLCYVALLAHNYLEHRP